MGGGRRRDHAWLWGAAAAAVLSDDMYIELDADGCRTDPVRVVQKRLSSPLLLECFAPIASSLTDGV